MSNINRLLKNGQTVGAYHFDTVVKVVGGPKLTKDLDHLVQRASARLIEETVELCLTAGMSTGDVYEAVTDAIHNEALKASVYPTKFQGHRTDHLNMIVELTDNHICADFIRHICDISPERIDQSILDKLELLRIRAEAGELKEVDLNIYKKSSGR